MPHTYEALKKMTVAELRDIPKDLQHEAVQGRPTATATPALSLSPWKGERLG